MLKPRKPNLREPVVEVAAKQPVTAAQRILSPVNAAREAAAGEAEMRWLWYVRLVVNKKNRGGYI